jgi:hypothetical protein
MATKKTAATKKKKPASKKAPTKKKIATQKKPATKKPASARETPALRFANWRRLERARATDTPSASYVEAIRLTRGVPKAKKGKTPWTPVKPDGLDAQDQARFVACARIFAAIDDAAPFAFEDLFSPRLAEVDRTGSFADDFEAANVEWWDVVDSRDRVVYTLLFMGPGYGKLMEGSSTRAIGYVNQYDLYPQEEPNPHADLWRELHAAQAEAKQRYPESELAEMAVPLP